MNKRDLSAAKKFSLLPVDDFTRRVSVRGPSLMWFLGAGASAAGGVPTANDMIWEFKQKLFVSQRRVPYESVADLSSEPVRARLQAHIDASEDLPPAGSPDEYGALFERVYPAESDRRSFIDGKLTGSKPSYGHIALATLMRADRAHVVWTTNFDSLVADACARVYGGTGFLTSVDLDAPDVATDAIAGERWPLEVKLHGDFRSRRLKNTGDELRDQDAKLRRNLIRECQRHGLIVVGYSGRDDSIMAALQEAAESPDCFPAGLFWLHRGHEPPGERVNRLLSVTAQSGVEVHLVEIDNFDEVMRDILRFGNFDRSELDTFAEGRRRWTPAPVPVGNVGWPVVRLNAIPVVRAPNVARRVVCEIGGTGEVRAAVAEAGVEVLAVRTSSGVLAYGTDADVRLAFDDYRISEFDLHPIDERRLRFDSSERGLLRDALTMALVKAHRLVAYRRRNSDLLRPGDPTNGEWRDLEQLVGPITGTVPQHSEIEWAEGIGTRLEWADDRMWLLLRPRTIFTGIDETNKAAAASFGRERTARRYNQQLNGLIGFWSARIADGGSVLQTFGIAGGVDARFELSGDTAYSRRVHP